VSPAQTISRLDEHRRSLGITRAANVTGLDYLGIPVFMAMRPNSRSISVSQGKGLDEESALASALMEAAESALAERSGLPVSGSSLESLSKSTNVVDPSLLPRLKGSRFTRHSRIEWIEGRDLESGERIFVPFDLVHTNFTGRPGGVFEQSSNGLASGNHRLEAIIAGLCETIERDATALWQARTMEERADRRLQLQSVRGADCRALLDRLDNRGISVAVWDATTDIGVACFVCRLKEANGNSRSALGAFHGAGCHLDRAVALSRAITEAAQSRLTYIAGSRDDLYRRNYRRARNETLFALAVDRWEQSLARRFADVPSLVTETLEEDVDILLDRLRAAGLRQAIAVDLTLESIGIPVIRIVVPGLEGHDESGRIRPGARMRAMRVRLAA
jgi:YcaO-like protein with predicted kinase domain